MSDPHLWWYITRASALVAWALMTVSVVWGILLSTRVLRKRDNPRWLADIHGYASGLALIMVLLHLVSLMLDGWLRFSISEVLVPFDSHYRNLPVAIGIVAFYLLLAVYASSLVMHRLPRSLWRGIHYASYASLILIAFHAGLTGTDVGAGWYRIVALTLIALAATAIVVRAMAGRRAAITPVKSPAVDVGAPAGGEPIEVSLAPGRRLARVTYRADVASDVISLRLMPLDANGWGEWTPGSHLTLHLPGGLERQYSLCGDPADRGSYEIAVRRASRSEGGSEWIHGNLLPAMELEISGPFNHFPLEPAADYRFIAGGIGITPIRAMIESLPSRRSWSLLYLGRSRATMPFAADLEALFPGRVFVFARDEHGFRPDISGFLAGSDPLVYTCGPESLMSTVSDLVAHERLRFERFVPVVRLANSAPVDVSVTLRKTGTRFTVEAGANVLETMEQNGVPVTGSCRKGVCGTCEVKVLSGTVEHLDSVLEDSTKDELGVMYPCVSRVTSREVVLDL